MDTTKGLLQKTRNGDYTINPIKALDTRINLNKQINESSPYLKRLLYPIADALNVTILDAAKQYPVAIGDIKTADKIHSFRKIPNQINDFIDRVRSKLPFKSWEKLAGTLDIIGSVLWQPVKGYKMMTEYPEVVKYYKELGNAASQQKFGAVTKIANKLTDIIGKSQGMDDTVDLDSII